MYKNIGNCYVYNGEIASIENFEEHLHAQTIIYEVVRVIGGRPLFLEDHLIRLNNSLEKSGMCVAIEDIREGIFQLIHYHQAFDKNIKIDVTKGCYRLYFVESSYPPDALYDEGVNVRTAKIIRDNPTVKALNMNYKSQIATLKEDYFEVLLVNESSEIIEGSKANLVFVKDAQLISAPLDQILVGVTFKNVLKMAEFLDLSVKYNSVKIGELSSIEACFLTGTSLGILPIHQIDDIKFHSEKHEIVIKLMQVYQQTIEGER